MTTEDELMELYSANFKRYVAFAAEMGRDRSNAEDCVQNAFISALRGARKFEGRDRCKVSTWFETILRNQILDCWRKLKRSKLRVELTEKSKSLNPEKAIVAKLVIEQAIRRTPKVHHKAITEMLEGIGPGGGYSTPRVRQRRARMALRERLN